MAKLSKDQTQKIFLSSLMLIALVYCYFDFLLGPVSRQAKTFESDTERLNTEIRKGRGEVRQYQELQAQADTAGETLLQIQEMVRPGAPEAWLPPEVKRFFQKQGITDVTMSVIGTERLTEEELVGYRKMSWKIEVPMVGFVPLGIAVAGFENQFPLMRISSLEIVSREDKPDMQTVTMNCISVFKPNE